MSLAPGDMAVIVAHRFGDLDAQLAVGTTVTIVAGPFESRSSILWSPYFRVSGLPKWLLDTQDDDQKGMCSSKILRKIPLADLGMDMLTEEEVTL